jgi:hypothetical protein
MQLMVRAYKQNSARPALRSRSSGRRYTFSPSCALDEKPDSQPARYSGKVVGDEMSLTVTLTDSRETFDTFTLTRGSQGRIWKCS